MQTEQFGVGMLLTSGYPLNTGQAVSFSQRLNVTGPFEYVQHRILTVQPKPNQTSSHHCINVAHSCRSTIVVCVRSLVVLHASSVCSVCVCAVVDEDRDMIDWLQWRWSKSIDRHTAWSTRSVSDWRSIAPGRQWACLSFVFQALVSRSGDDVD